MKAPRKTRDGPWCWQSKAVRRAIRERFDSSNSVTTALSLYDALTEEASDKQSEIFKTTHAWLQLLSGVGVSTIKKHLAIFDEMQIISIQKTPGPKGPLTYTLLSIANQCPTIANGDGNGSLAALEEYKEESKESLNKGAGQLRAEAIFNRRPTTALNAKEEKAWKSAQAIVEATPEEDFALVERFYSAEETKGKPLYRRKSLEQLLNNWSGEIDKARQWAKTAIDSKYDQF